MTTYKLLISLKHLDISSNRLTKTKQFCFSTLNSLKTFHLQKNSISNLDDYSFYQLLHLELLDLSCNKILNLKNNLFNGLNNIKIINLTFNLIMFIDHGVFRDVSPNTVHSLNSKVCCMHGSWTKCKVKEDMLSNCDDLLSNKFMKSLSFVMGSLVAFLNIISFFLNIRMPKPTQNICSIYLAFIDGCFGVYLLIIAIADMHYKGNYIGLEMSWRGSLGCKLASFFAFVSMTVSPIIICFMILITFCVIQWPMTSKFKDKSFAKRVIEVSFSFSICFCIVLFSNIINFLGNHGMLGVCLPLFTFHAHSLLLLFSTLVVLTVQTFCLVTIFTLSIVSLHTLKKVERYTKTQTRSTKYGKVLKHLFMVIITNCCCWIPSSTVFILPICGYQVPSYLLNLITIMVVPITSALDPIIFTLSTPEMKKNFIRFIRCH